MRRRLVNWWTFDVHQRQRLNDDWSIMIHIQKYNVGWNSDLCICLTTTMHVFHHLNECRNRIVWHDIAPGSISLAHNFCCQSNANELRLSIRGAFTGVTPEHLGYRVNALSFYAPPRVVHYRYTNNANQIHHRNWWLWWSSNHIPFKGLIEQDVQIESS